MKHRTTRVSLNYIELTEISTMIEWQIKSLKNEDSETIQNYCEWLEDLNKKIDRAGDRLLFTPRDPESH